ncbi:aminotransferase class V-fold PLP-dependent enzyme, partial [Candidatus Micrarchaeota archaeon]|nr:aminotransferase class V-fold PLP-dependent enzyme [Candidatus Micrarchaeota archaeon]
MNLSSHFPMPNGKIYFDSAASSITAMPVLEKMQEFYTTYRANIHRGEHSLTKKASEEYELVYEKLAKFFHADSQEFINLRNATEAINGVSLGLDWQPDDEVIITDAEHHSNLLPWLRLKEKGVKLKVLEIDINGIINEENLKTLISKKTKLVAFTASSNVVAAKVPVMSLTKIAKDNGSLVLVDAAQYVGHQPIDLKNTPV